MTLNWKQIKTNLRQINLPFKEGSPNPQIATLADLYGFVVHNMIVDISGIESIEDGEGVVVTYKNKESNNGVYLFCFQSDGSTGLLVIIPSTISKGPMIRKTVGDISTAIAGLDLPTLTTFDNSEVVGFVVVETVLKPMMRALQIPKDKEQTFLNIYLPRFMANVTCQYLGSSSIREESVDIEPQMVKEMIMHPEKFSMVNKSQDDPSSTDGVPPC